MPKQMIKKLEIENSNFEGILGEIIANLLTMDKMHIVKIRCQIMLLTKVSAIPLRWIVDPEREAPG
jgi:hypothetical protein